MKQVLVVEDTRTTAAAIIYAMEAHGWTARHVITGAGAMALIDGGYMPDLVLTDVSLPCMDGGGISLAAILKHRGIKVILMSASGAAHLRDAAEALGVPFLQKAFSIQDVLALLE